MPTTYERGYSGTWPAPEEVVEQLNQWRSNPRTIEYDESSFIPPYYERRTITPANCPYCNASQPSVEIAFASPISYSTTSEIDVSHRLRSAIKELGCPEYQEMDKFLISLKPLIESRKFFEYMVQECEDEHVRTLYQTWKETGVIPDGYA